MCKEMLFPLWLFMVLLGGCREITNTGNAINLYEYFIYSDTYAYSLSSQVITTDIVPSLSVKEGDTWQYYTFSEENIENTLHYTHVICSLSMVTDSQLIIMQGSFDAYNDSDGYTSSATFTLDSLQKPNNLIHYYIYPVFCQQEIMSPFVGIQMDDGSTWFRTETAIFSSRLGKVVQFFDWDTVTLVRKNSQPVDIGYQLNEFLEKEKCLYE